MTIMGHIRIWATLRPKAAAFDPVTQDYLALENSTRRLPVKYESPHRAKSSASCVRI